MGNFFRKISHHIPNWLLSPLLYINKAGFKKYLFRHPEMNDPRLQKMAFYQDQVAPERLLIDVTHQVYSQDRSGIPRVVNKTSEALLGLDQNRFSFEFVMILNNELYTARRFSERILKLETGSLGVDQPVKIRHGDHMLILDCTMDKYRAFSPSFDAIHTLGGTVSTVINDIMPMRNPEWLPDDFVTTYQNTLPVVVRSSDILFCVSEYTASDLREWIREDQPDEWHRVVVTTFEQGAEIGSSSDKAEPIRPALAQFLEAAANGNAPLFLQVSIIQPRKGQDVALDVFEQLWASGRNERLIYVGRKGWKAEELFHRIVTHPETGQRFLFVENANETELVLIYDSATALISPSRGEGYGLPVVEAALRGIPVLLNDIPVYREVAGDGGIYFDVKYPESMHRAIARIEALSPEERKAQARKIHVGTWAQGAADLLTSIEKVADLQ